ncbi:MAG: hypothetical protein RLZ98_627 [Pseudomonadota bacterium]|jgi:phospholipid transport system substrate-binding protein
MRPHRHGVVVLRVEGTSKQQAARNPIINLQDSTMLSLRPFSTASLLASTLLALALLITPTGHSEAAPADPAVTFMQRVAKDLISAAKSGSEDQFKQAIFKHGHYRDIAHFALGDYKPRLTSGDRKLYYDGMVKFISRYAANESKKYRVATAQIFGPSTRTNQGVFVDSRVQLEDGSTYDVRWLLVPRGRSFMVRDAQVLTFWMTPFLRDLFVKYISENGGQIRALVFALNQ